MACNNTTSCSHDVSDFGQYTKKHHPPMFMQTTGGPASGQPENKILFENAAHRVIAPEVSAEKTWLICTRLTGRIAVESSSVFHHPMELPLK